MTYVGNIGALQKSFGYDIKFEDRFSFYIEENVDRLLAEMPTDRPDIERRVINELMGSAVDNIINSHFDGNYIMIQALEEAKPPKLEQVLSRKELLPYAGNYMRLACQHIVFNQIVEAIRHEYPHAVRVSRNYFQHGLAILLAFLYYNRHSEQINRQFHSHQLGEIIPCRSYRDYARIAIDIFDSIYQSDYVQELINLVVSNWHDSPTPLGAELEFSALGSKAVFAKAGEDPQYDGFYWFRDFDMFHRIWRLGGHVDSHRHITIGQKRHRGFLEYAFGRFQIVGDLSLPLFACPWCMSKLINEAVKFLDIRPHSLHLSMELGGSHSHITDRQHNEEDLVCLLLLGGDLHPDSDGVLREWRVHNQELDTNFKNSLHFSDRKHHFSKVEQEEEEAADVMEYKFMRLYREETDYESLILALKGYQLHTHTRPVNILKEKKEELPEQILLRKWAEHPQALSTEALNCFANKVEQGLLEENNSRKLDRHLQDVMLRIFKHLAERNQLIADYHA